MQCLKTIHRLKFNELAIVTTKAFDFLSRPKVMIDKLLHRPADGRNGFHISHGVIVQTGSAVGY